MRNLFDLFKIFACSHPLARLSVVRQPTVIPADFDFEHITFHFHCSICDQDVDKHYAHKLGVQNERTN